MIKSEDVCGMIRKKCGISPPDADKAPFYFSKNDYQTVLNKINFLEDKVRELEDRKLLIKELLNELRPDILKELVRELNEKKSE